MCIRDSDDTAALQAIHQNEIAFMSAGTISPVSYTHLDVYKRQQPYDYADVTAL